MFGIADLLTVAVIRQGLEHFKQNPLELEYVLGGFAREPLLSMVGVEHIKQCIEFVTKNQIQVAPYYEIDLKRRPFIGVVASGRENQQFLGDYGSVEVPNLPELRLPPRVYVQFDAVGISEDRQILYVSRDSGVGEKLWPGLILTNGEDSTKVRGILVRDGSQTAIYLTEKLPENTILRGWRAQSMEREKGIVVNASQDDVVIQLSLCSHGAPSVHRLFQIVVRACLKRGRMLFDQWGLQVATFSYAPLVISEGTEHEAESVLTIEAKYTDTWIEREFDLNDATDQVLICATAVPETPTEEKQDVPLD